MASTPQTPKDHAIYVSAPTSPSVWSLHSLQFYSAPASPTDSDNEFSQRKMEMNEDFNSNFDDFEFETSKNFGPGGFGFETSGPFECLSDDQERQVKEKQPQRGDSLPTMAFADELFYNGLVMPLKLPPRLQYVNDTKRVGLNSTASSPRSPGSGFRMPFSWWTMSDDDFDPFTVALEKVKGEKRRKNHANHHRRSRSLSPFRTTTPKRSNDDSEGWNQDQDKLGSPLELKQYQFGPNPDGPKESKGSAYARWVRDQNQQMGLKKSPNAETSPKGPSKTKGWFRKGVKPVKMEQEGAINPTSTTIPWPKVKKGERSEESGEGSCYVETRVQKVGRFLMRYASFGRENNEDKPIEQEKALVKASYFRGLSFSFKGNANRNGKKKKVHGESNMAIAKAWPRPKLTLCLGYGIGSPRART
ncbi:uncharacterized protein LOC132311509 [Cornus florida]|uniref:uncharacterized protein LOC132311509 n=1 Tax=Cornus florida TaxID=4283 RepID=UPI002897B925|nr:uncharacterized protein LOC132311509 [Cornus florida]